MIVVGVPAQWWPWVTIIIAWTLLCITLAILDMGGRK